MAQVTGVLRLVWAADGSLLAAELEVAVDTHALGVVFLVGVGALGDQALLANCGLFSLLLFGPPSRALFSNELWLDWRLSGVFQVLWT